MPRSHNTALEQAEGRLDRVRRNAHSLFVAHVLIRMVVDGLVLPAILRVVEVIDLGVVRHNNVHGLVHIPSNDVVYGLLVDVGQPESGGQETSEQS